VEETPVEGFTRPEDLPMREGISSLAEGLTANFPAGKRSSDGGREPPFAFLDQHFVAATDMAGAAHDRLPSSGNASAAS
jgi:hypothetical protein